MDENRDQRGILELDARKLAATSARPFRVTGEVGKKKREEGSGKFTGFVGFILR